jgi:hypothetical protein
MHSGDTKQVFLHVAGEGEGVALVTHEILHLIQVLA